MSCALQEVQSERRESDIGQSNVVTLGNQRQRNGGSEHSHAAQKQNQQQASVWDLCHLLCPHAKNVHALSKGAQGV